MSAIVTNLARPNSNLTGVNFLPAEVVAKRLELLHELVPGAARVAVFVGPTNPTTAESTLREMEALSRTTGLQIRIHNVSISREIDEAFVTFERDRPDILFVAITSFFVDRRVQFALQAMTHKVPATYPARDFAEVGGLMSYGASLHEAIARPASMPAASSRALSPGTCRSCNRTSSIGHQPSIEGRTERNDQPN
jgi:ABC-type uncharacterized transport system substrate-binding protein